MQGHKGESSSNSLPNQVTQNRVDPNMNPIHTHQHHHHHHGHNITVNPSTVIGMKPSNYASSSSSSGETEDRHLTRKRKATELDIGSSSSRVESSNIFGMPDGSKHEWQSGSENPTPTNTISFDPIIPRLGSRVRINNSRQQEPLPTNDNNNDNNNGLFNFSSRYSSLGLNPVTTTGESSSSHAGHPMLRALPSTRSLLASSRIRSSSLRANPPVSSNSISGPGDNPIATPTNISEHSLFVPSHDDLINPAASVGPHRSSSLYSSRRRSELLRRHLLSMNSGAAGGGEGQTSNLFSRIPPPLRASPSLQETGIPSVTGLPYPHRHLSQIRDLLDTIRRGEGLRFEDFMMLDQSVFYGMADIHDRHGDMRLDIDNMSYEELLALEERIGNVNTGLTEENVDKHLKLKTFVGVADAEPCCICQEEYKDGDDLGGLECGHEYHRGCIRQWLLQKNLCPVCKCEASK
ncbi:uncharacterized protein LOC143596911 [Bidens hawaiensis]|uniref:uncharacterized protein LOC143596911 n=1 Tax=Bidens hawaiensis TaxID=980011 RepID=UPI00404934A9